MRLTKWDYRRKAYVEINDKAREESRKQLERLRNKRGCTKCEHWNDYAYSCSQNKFDDSTHCVLEVDEEEWAI